MKHSIYPSELSLQVKNVYSTDDNFYLFINAEFTPVRFSNSQNSRYDLWHFKNNLFSVGDKKLKINNVEYDISKESSIMISKKNQEYIKRIEFEYTGIKGIALSYLNRTLEEFNSNLPLGYRAEYKDFDSLFFKKEMKRKFFIMILAVIILIYILCAILFENLKYPLIILLIIPVSFIGLFLTYYIFNVKIDQGSFASFVLLSGVTVNAGIYLVFDYIYLTKNTNSSQFDVVLITLKGKLLPITLTIFSSIVGFIPFVINNQGTPFWYSFATGTIGGLLFSFLAILFLVPVLLIDRKEV